MILFPAIDLKQGQCVRLRKGKMDTATVFNSNPANQAQLFHQQGCKWIHIVDLDGAFNGTSVNSDAIKTILTHTDVHIQLGGGIRTIEAIEYWLNAGVKRVILGTAALQNAETVKEACKKFPGKIILGIDTLNGYAAAQGWSKQSKLTAIDLVKTFAHSDIAAIIYTNINHDGVLEGPDLEGTKSLAATTRIPVIASGGIASLNDIQTLKAIEPLGIEGVIVGRALYDNKFTVSEALHIC